MHCNYDDDDDSDDTDDTDVRNAPFAFDYVRFTFPVGSRCAHEKHERKSWRKKRKKITNKSKNPDNDDGGNTFTASGPENCLKRQRSTTPFMRERGIRRTILLSCATAREPVRPRVWDCGCLLRVHPHKRGGGGTPAPVSSPGNRSGTSLVDGPRTAQSLVYAVERRHVFPPPPGHVLLRHRTINIILSRRYIIILWYNNNNNNNNMIYWQARETNNNNNNNNIQV